MTNAEAAGIIDEDRRREEFNCEQHSRVVFPGENAADTKKRRLRYRKHVQALTMAVEALLDAGE